MAKKPSREVFHSVPSKTGKGWDVTAGGEVQSHHRTQAASEKAAVRAGNKAHDQGGLGQAVLHKADGKVREERTYGNDPKRSPG